MNLIGEKVVHKTYGEGVVSEIKENKIEVVFDSLVKLFLYPDAFEKHLHMSNKKAQSYVKRELSKMNKIKMQEQEDIKTHIQAIIHMKKKKVSTNSQAVFALDKETLENIQNNWKLFTGYTKTGKRRGEPKIPKLINMNSACLLTMKEEGDKEENRIIVGIFMVIEYFIGEKCNTGIIPAHEKYRILWDDDQEKLKFWDFLPEHLRLEKWGSSEVKYMTSSVIKRILEAMEKVSTGEMQERVKSFYQYFIELNE